MNSEMNTMELNRAELEQVNGGNSWCVGLGISSETEAGACAYHGNSTGGCKDESAGVGATACIWHFGIGLGVVQNARL